MIKEIKKDDNRDYCMTLPYSEEKLMVNSPETDIDSLLFIYEDITIILVIYYLSNTRHYSLKTIHYSSGSPGSAPSPRHMARPPYEAEASRHKTVAVSSVISHGLWENKIFKLYGLLRQISRLNITNQFLQLW